MPAEIVRLSEGDSKTIPADHHARKRVSVGSGDLTINENVAESEKYEPVKPGFTKIYKTVVVVRGPGVFAVADIDPDPAFGVAPDSVEPKKAKKDEPKPNKKYEGRKAA